MPYRPGDDTFQFEAKQEHETEKAILVQPTIGEQAWLPKSQLVERTDPGPDGTIMFTVTGWWAAKQGWC